jgi:hypothetical protein
MTPDTNPTSSTSAPRASATPEVWRDVRATPAPPTAEGPAASTSTVEVETAPLPDAARAVFIDWGPDLPGRFPTGRARLLVVNPTTLHLSWEVPATSARAAAEAWLAEVRVDGGIVAESQRVPAVPGYFAGSCWLTVSPRTEGVVRLLSVEGGIARRVADLAFETPPAGPSTDFTERWGSLDRLGSLIRDAEAVEGARVEELPAEPPPELSPATSTAVAANPRR